MTTELQAMRMALEALESLFSGQVDDGRPQRCGDAIIALRAAIASHEAQAGDLDDMLIVRHLSPRADGESLRSCIDRIIDWEVSVSLDPAVSSAAEALVQRGRDEAQAGEAVAPSTGWLRDGALLYRLNDARRPVNKDEIRVTMANGSRSPEACEFRAKELHARLTRRHPHAERGEQAPTQQPAQAVGELPPSKLWRDDAGRSWWGADPLEWHHIQDYARAALAAAPRVPQGFAVLPNPITEDMHVAAAKVLIRAHGLDATPQRVLDALIASAPQPEGAREGV